jgi:hypothetical protein
MLARRSGTVYPEWPKFRLLVVLNDYARPRVRKDDMLQWLEKQTFGEDESRFLYVSGGLRFDFRRREYMFEEQRIRILVTSELSLYRALMLGGIGNSEKVRLSRTLWRGKVSQEAREAIKKELEANGSS